MTPPLPPRILAEIGGVAVAEQGPLVIVVDRGTSSWSTAAFVLGVIALVVGGFGAVTLVPAIAGGFVSWWLSASFLAVGTAFGLTAVGVVRRIRKARARPVSDYRPVAIFDRVQRVLIDADGVAVAPLNEIRFDTRMQMTSSAPTLVVMTPIGARNIKRSNLFNGGLGNLEAVLTAAVFGPPR